VYTEATGLVRGGGG